MDNISFMPKQNISEAEKNANDKEWYKECCNAAVSLISTTNNSRRSTRKNKLINYDLYNGRLNKKDLKYVINPFGLEEEDTPAELRHYDKVSSIFNVLIGEEAKKPFNFVVRAINEEAISNREKAIKDKFVQFMQEELERYQTQNPQDNKSPQQDPEFEKKYKQFQYEMTYEFQDITELFATRVLNYLRRILDVDKTLLLGFEDALISSEELYRIDIIQNQPHLKRVNPIETYFLLPHNCVDIDEAETIIEETWMTNSQLIETFYDELTEEQITFLEGGSGLSSEDGLGYYSQFPMMMNDATDAIFVPEEAQTYENLTSMVDSRGNRRVLRVVWKSKTEVYVVTTNDEEGNEITEVYSKDYKPSKGENFKKVWINEYRECTKISSDIYVHMQPCRVQRRSIGNIAKCKSPYVGSIYSNGIVRAVSLMDRLKAYQYLYDIMMYRTELLIAKSYGKIMEFDLASIPKSMGFDVDKWLYYLSNMGISFKNSREEDQKGVAIGMMGGGQTATREINLEQGQFINQHIQLLSYIEQQIASISGVSPQRMGAIGADELVGNVQRSVNQSAYITEKYSYIHNQIKKRVYEAIIEVAKECYRNRQLDIVDVTGDLATKHLKVDGNQLENSVHGVFVSNSGADQKIYDKLEQMVDIAMSNDKINFSQAMKLIKSESIAEITKEIEMMENEQAAQIQQQQQQEQQLTEEQMKKAEEQMQYAREIQERTMDLNELKVAMDNENKERDRIAKAEIEFAKLEKESVNIQTGTVDDKSASEADRLKHSIDLMKLNLEQSIANRESLFKQQEISLQKRKLDIDEQKVANDLQKARIQASSKPKVTTKKK